MGAPGTPCPCPLLVPLRPSLVFSITFPTRGCPIVSRVVVSGRLGVVLVFAWPSCRVVFGPGCVLTHRGDGGRVKCGGHHWETVVVVMVVGWSDVRGWLRTWEKSRDLPSGLNKTHDLVIDPTYVIVAN